MMVPDLCIPSFKNVGGQPSREVISHSGILFRARLLVPFNPKIKWKMTVQLCWFFNTFQDIFQFGVTTEGWTAVFSSNVEEVLRLNIVWGYYYILYYYVAGLKDICTHPIFLADTIFVPNMESTVWKDVVWKEWILFLEQILLFLNFGAAKTNENSLISARGAPFVRFSVQCLHSPIAEALVS